MKHVHVIVQGAIAALLIVGFVVLTALGQDGSILLALLGGQGIGVGGAEAGRRISGRGS